MKNEFAFLFPQPRTVFLRAGFSDIRELSFPLEICKKYDFLFDHFEVKNKNRGLEILFQEANDLAAEEYVLESAPKRILVLAGSAAGQFYALATLLQILSYFSGSGRMPVFSIRDAPEIAVRGFVFATEGGAVPLAAELQRLLLKLALLRFNHFALPASSAAGLGLPAPGRAGKGAASGAAMAVVAARAQKMGMEIFLLPADASAAPGRGPDPAGAGLFPARLELIGWEGGEKKTRAAAGFENFLNRYRLGKAGGKKMLAWADGFREHAEWIRKISHDVLVLNRETELSGPADLQNRIGPFKKHHVRQVLCPTVWSRDRFIPAMRRSMAGISAAFCAAKTEKLAGVMLIGGEGGASACLPEAGALLHFEAGSLFWSGRPPVPSAFSRWALGRDEPDLFRVYSFLAQVDLQLPHTHCQYLFEDPVFASFSRTGDPREIEAYYHKTALYLKKRKIARNELSDFLGFARQLFEFIAAKVEFSRRLCSLLEEKDGPEKIRHQAAWLGKGTAKLKSLYLELRGKSFQPEGLTESVAGFGFLQERFHYLHQASSRSESVKNLLLELKNDSPPSSLAFPYNGEFRKP